MGMQQFDVLVFFTILATKDALCPAGRHLVFVLLFGGVMEQVQQVHALYEPFWMLNLYKEYDMQLPPHKRVLI